MAKPSPKGSSVQLVPRTRDARNAGVPAFGRKSRTVVTRCFPRSQLASGCWRYHQSASDTASVPRSRVVVSNALSGPGPVPPEVLFAVLAFNLFWFAGEALRAAVYPIDDEAALARTLHWPSWWHPLCVVLAFTSYLLGVRLLMPVFRSVAGDNPRTSVLSRVLSMYLGQPLPSLSKAPFLRPVTFPVR